MLLHAASTFPSEYSRGLAYHAPADLQGPDGARCLRRWKHRRLSRDSVHFQGAARQTQCRPGACNSSMLSSASLVGARHGLPTEEALAEASALPPSSCPLCLPVHAAALDWGLRGPIRMRVWPKQSHRGNLWGVLVLCRRGTLKNSPSLAWPECCCAVSRNGSLRTKRRGDRQDPHFGRLLMQDDVMMEERIECQLELARRSSTSLVSSDKAAFSF